MSLIDISFEEPGTLKFISEILSNIKSEVNADFFIDDSPDNDDEYEYDEEDEDEKIDIDEDNEEDEEDEEDNEKDEGDGKLVKKQKGMIKIVTADINQVILVYITIKNKAFNRFKLVGADKYTIGIDTDELNKYMKSINKDGKLEISYNKNFMRYIVFTNSTKDGSMTNVCELRKINVEPMTNKTLEIDVIVAIEMSSSVFHKHCKDLAQYSDHVKFKCDNGKFAIICPSAQSNREYVHYDRRRIDTLDDDEDDDKRDKKYDVKITYVDEYEDDSDEDDSDVEEDEEESDVEDNEENEDDENDSDVEEDEDNDEEDEEDDGYEYEYEYEEDAPVNRLVEATYDVRNFNHFYKCGNAADKVYIHINNHGVAFLSYDIPKLGNILVAVSPSNKGQKSNYNRDMNKYYESDKTVKLKKDI